MTLACLLLAATLGIGSAEEVRVGETVCRLAVNATAIALSDELHLTLSVEGKSPIDVDVPKALTQSPDWRVRAGAATTTRLPDGRERWEQAFRLEPFQTGAAVALPVQPLNYRTGNEVADRVMTWKPLAIRVTTNVTGTDLTQARPTTGIEELPPVPQSTFPWIAVVSALFVVVLVMVTFAMGLRKRGAKPATPSARELALEQLDRLISRSDFGPRDVERLADIVRRFFEHHLSLAATKQTTAEFLTSVRQSGTLSAESVLRLDELMRRCDLVKFAGLRSSVDDGKEMLGAARRLIFDD